ncbi:MAG: NADH-quinone oxidoreductase subunit M, partial [Candidatus Methylomirabilia bacterium]
MPPLLSLVVFLPTLGALGILLLPRPKEALIRWTAFLVSTATLLVSLGLYSGFDSAEPGYQFAERLEWMPTFGITYRLGVDGISLLLVLLTTFLTPLALLSAWTAIEHR